MCWSVTKALVCPQNKKEKRKKHTPDVPWVADGKERHWLHWNASRWRDLCDRNVAFVTMCGQACTCQSASSQYVFATTCQWQVKTGGDAKLQTDRDETRRWLKPLQQQKQIAIFISHSHSCVICLCLYKTLKSMTQLAKQHWKVN